MKASFLLLAFGLLGAACQKKEVTPAEPVEAEDPDWVKLNMPATLWSEDIGDAAYAIVGDIDQTLLVATTTQVFATSDQGKTWQMSRNFNGPLPGLLQRNDTVFALTLSGSSSQVIRKASHADMFTTDFGKTWAYTTTLPGPFERYRTISRPIGRVGAAGITYQTKENTEPIPNSTSRRVLAHDLLRTDGTGQTALRLPARHYLNNLHLDAQNRLYIAASSLRFKDNSNETIVGPLGKRPAVVYISRRPLP